MGHLGGFKEKKMHQIPRTMSNKWLSHVITTNVPSIFSYLGWDGWMASPESEWTPGVGDGQGGLACCDSWGLKESDTTERLNWTEHTLLVNSISLTDTIWWVGLAEEPAGHNYYLWDWNYISLNPTQVESWRNLKLEKAKFIDIDSLSSDFTFNVASWGFRKDSNSLVGWMKHVDQNWKSQICLDLMWRKRFKCFE